MTIDERQALLWLTAHLTERRAAGDDVTDDWRLIEQLQTSLDVPAEQVGARELLGTLVRKYRDTAS